MRNSLEVGQLLAVKDGVYYYIIPLRTKLYLSNLKTHFVPRTKHSVSGLKSSKLMLYTEIIAVCPELHAKHINALWAEHRISEC